MHWVYVLENRKGGWYIGYSPNLKRRLREHRTGKGGRTTARDTAWVLIYCEGYKNKQDAIGREKFLKSGSGYIFLQKQLRHYLDEE